MVEFNRERLLWDGMSEAKLEGAMGIIGDGESRVRNYGGLGDGVWRERKGKQGVLHHVSQPEEDRKAAEKVVGLLDDFQQYWKETFASDKTSPFNPSREMVREVFERTQSLENDLNELFIDRPEALKAWAGLKLFGKSSRRNWAMEARVIEKEKADTVWERALGQIDGTKRRDEYFFGNPEKQEGSWVLDGLDRLDMIVHMERVNVHPFVNFGKPHKQNYESFKGYIRKEEKGWGKTVEK